MTFIAYLKLLRFNSSSRLGLVIALDRVVRFEFSVKLKVLRSCTVVEKARCIFNWVWMTYWYNFNWNETGDGGGQWRVQAGGAGQRRPTVHALHVGQHGKTQGRGPLTGTRRLDRIIMLWTSVFYLPKVQNVCALIKRLLASQIMKYADTVT